MIQLRCEHCGRQLRVADKHAGKKAKCPNCGQVIRVPSVDAAPSASTSESLDRADTRSRLSARDLALLDLPPEPPGKAKADGQGTTSNSDTESVLHTEVGPEGEHGEPTSVQAPARFIDALLYPANLDGLVQIGIWVVGWWALDLLGGMLSRLAGHYGIALALVLRFFFLGYILFYLGYCIFDSSKGSRRAPTISTAPADKGDLITQWLLLVGSLAVCLWPAAMYYGFTEQRDERFWALAGLGAFFLPMTLLTGTLFDSIGALNPILIVKSILMTLPAYLGLLVKLSMVAALAATTAWISGRLPIPGIIPKALYLYLLPIAAHLLGRFYWQHKDRLQWGL